MKRDLWSRVIEACGLVVENGQLDTLEIYHDWLADEAIVSGGVGPHEAPEIATRHIADSILFARCIPETTRILDLGTGVGLPAIPLAIVLPWAEVSALDRSGRRIDLLKRAIRITGLQNVVPVQGDIRDLDDPHPTVVSRASLPVAQLTDLVPGLVSAGGVAVVGGSWTNRPESPGWETVEVGREVLDREVWLLIMRRQ